MKRYLIILALFAFALSVGSADKKAKEEQPVKLRTLFKTAKLALKNNNNHDAAEKGLLAALPREDVDNKDRARIYYTAALLQQNLNGVHNRSAYLKQKYDTAAFFATTLNMYQHLMRCDSVDMIPNAKGVVKRKYQSDVASLMNKHRKNLLNGGIFQMKKKAYPVAFDYMDTYLKTNRNPKDTIIPRVSYWATICAYNAKNPVNTRRYIDAAIAWADSAQKPILQEYKAKTYVWQNDETNWIKELNAGVKRYPEHDYFFLNLLDWYNTHHQYDQGLALADSLLDVHHEKPLFWYAKSLLSFGKEDYQNCIQFSDSCIIRDKNYADAYYNKGLSFCNLALIAQQDACNDLKNPKCVEDRRVIQSLYQSARPCMEKVRQLQPENSVRWASPLYRIYLNLNMGKEFDEIDAVLKKMK